MKRWAILLDFDGTVTTRDISDSILNRFTPLTRREIAFSRQSGKVTEEWVREKFLQVKEPLAELRRFCLKIGRLRAGFGRLLSYCRARRYPVEIISGGFDIYVDMLLENWGFLNVPHFCAKARWTPSGLFVSYPFLKGGTLDDFKASRAAHYMSLGCRVLYGGDGQSDLEAARMVDVVFARRTLLKFCRREGISAASFETFNKMLAWLKKESRS